MTTLALGAGLVSALAVLLWAVKRWGRVEGERDAATHDIARAAQALEIDEAVSRLDDRALDERLRLGR